MTCSQRVVTLHMDTPIGVLKILACGDGLHSICQTDETDECFHPDLSIPVALTETDVEEPYLSLIKDVLAWFKGYFSSPKSTRNLDLPKLCHLSQSSDFHWRVWTALAERVPPEQTISYGELAVLAGSTKGAAVAVGQAMAKNPFQIIVPCHRVLPNSGKVGHYARGTKNGVKSFLLSFEGCHVVE